MNFGHCWGLRKRGQSSQGACKEEGEKRRKVKKKKERKLTFESKTAGGELKPGSSGHIGTKFNTEENESIHLVKLKRGCRYNEAHRWRTGRYLSVVVHMIALFVCEAVAR